MNNLCITYLNFFIGELSQEVVVGVWALVAGPYNKVLKNRYKYT